MSVDNLGLATVISLAERNLSFEFNEFCVWDDGKDLFYDDSRGCSCSSPFDGVHTKEDLNKCPPQLVEQAIATMLEWSKRCGNNAPSPTDLIEAERCIRKVADDILRGLEPAITEKPKRNCVHPNPEKCFTCVGKRNITCQCGETVTRDCPHGKEPLAYDLT